MAYCKRCNRKIDGRRSHHVCDMAVVMDKKTKKTRTVHVDRIEQGGDLHKEVGNNGKLEVVLRNKTKIEKLFEKEKKKEAA